MLSGYLYPNLALCHSMFRDETDNSLTYGARADFVFQDYYDCCAKYAFSVKAKAIRSRHKSRYKIINRL